MLFRSTTFAGITGNSTVAPELPGSDAVGVGACTCSGAGVLVGLGVYVGRDVRVGPGAVQVQAVMTAETVTTISR
jgi:hypothetical protein